MATVATRTLPLTDGELHRLAVLVRRRLEMGSVLGVDVDRRTLELLYRLVENERERRRIA